MPFLKNNQKNSKNNGFSILKSKSISKPTLSQTKVKHISGAELFRKDVAEPKQGSTLPVLNHDPRVLELVDELLFDLDQYLNGYESKEFLQQVIADENYLRHDVWCVLDNDSQTLASRFVKMATSPKKEAQVNELLNYLFLSVLLTWSGTSPSHITFLLTHKNANGDQLFHDCLYAKSPLLFETCWAALLEMHKIEQYVLKKDEKVSQKLKKELKGVTQVFNEKNNEYQKVKEKLHALQELKEKLNEIQTLKNKKYKRFQLGKKLEELATLKNQDVLKDLDALEQLETLNEIEALKKLYLLNELELSKEQDLLNNLWLLNVDLVSKQLQISQLEPRHISIDGAALHDLLMRPDSRGWTPFALVIAANSVEMLQHWFSAVREGFASGWMSANDVRMLMTGMVKTYELDESKIKITTPLALFVLRKQPLLLECYLKELLHYVQHGAIPMSDIHSLFNRRHFNRNHRVLDLALRNESHHLSTQPSEISTVALCSVLTRDDFNEGYRSLNRALPEQKICFVICLQYLSLCFAKRFLDKKALFSLLFEHDLLGYSLIHSLLTVGHDVCLHAYLSLITELKNKEILAYPDYVAEFKKLDETKRSVVHQAVDNESLAMGVVLLSFLKENLTEKDYFDLLSPQTLFSPEHVVTGVRIAPRCDYDKPHYSEINSRLYKELIRLQLALKPSPYSSGHRTGVFFSRAPASSDAECSDQASSTSGRSFGNNRSCGRSREFNSSFVERPQEMYQSQNKLNSSQNKMNGTDKKVNGSQKHVSWCPPGRLTSF